MTQLQIFKTEKLNNPTISCRYNERLVLHLVQAQKSASKAKLARLSGLTAAAIGGIITSLQRKGLVEPAGKIQGDMGQPATLFKLVPEGALGLGLSINRGSIETLVTNFVGEIIASKKHDIALPEPNVVVEMVVQDIAELKQTLGQELSPRIAGLGVAHPFFLRSRTSENIEYHRWKNFDLNAQLKTASGLPVFAENDTNAAALAELVHGLGQMHEDFAYVFFGSAIATSLGGGIVLDKEFRSGYTGNAGNIGLMPCATTPLAPLHNQPPPSLYSRVSMHSLAKHLAGAGAKVDTLESFTEASTRYKTQVETWLNDCAKALEFAIQGMQAMLDIPVVIFDCEDRDKPLVEKIVARVNTRLTTGDYGDRNMPVVKMGTQGSRAAAVGAATLPLNYHFSLKTEQR